MEVTLIDNWSEFHDLEEEWDDLLKKTSADTIFLTRSWMRSWLEVWADYYKPYVLIVRDDSGLLLGVAPFYQGQCRLLGLLKYRVLRIIGDVDSGSEYPAWLAITGCEENVFGCIVAELRRRQAEWDCIWMPRVAGWISVHKHIIHACKNYDFLVNARPRYFSAISLPQDMPGFYARQSKNRRQQLKRQLRKVLASSAVKICQCTKEKDIPRYIDQLFELNHKRWSREGIVGIFYRKPQEAMFYKAFIPRALTEGWLSFYSLENDDGVKAIQVGYTYNNTFHQLQEGFDPDFCPGVGNVLRWHVIEDCIARGVDSYDFLGGVSEHKKRWGADSRIGQDIFIGVNKIKNTLIFRNHIWPTGRYFTSVYPKFGMG